jgi:hypothetical protein
MIFLADALSVMPMPFPRLELRVAVVLGVRQAESVGRPIPSADLEDQNGRKTFNVELASPHGHSFSTHRTSKITCTLIGISSMSAHSGSAAIAIGIYGE